MELKCKCGNPSMGNVIKTYHKKKDGTISEYNHPDKRCRECYNKVKRKSQSYEDRKNNSSGNVITSVLPYW